MSIILSGHSDDIVSIGGDVSEEIYAEDQAITVGTKADGGCLVRIKLGAHGCWEATISLLDEDVAIPWPVEVTSSGYSVVVEVDCPAGTPTHVGKPLS